MWVLDVPRCRNGDLGALCRPSRPSSPRLNHAANPAPADSSTMASPTAADLRECRPGSPGERCRQERSRGLRQPAAQRRGLPSAGVAARPSRALRAVRRATSTSQGASEPLMRSDPGTAKQDEERRLEVHPRPRPAGPCRWHADQTAGPCRVRIASNAVPRNRRRAAGIAPATPRPSAPSPLPASEEPPQVALDRRICAVLAMDACPRSRDGSWPP